MKPALILAVTLAAFAAPARADVFEIGADGVMVRLDAPPAAPAPSAARVSRVASERRAALMPVLTQAGAHAAVSPSLLEAVAYVESRFNHRAVSPAGAIGAMQLMPGTAAQLGVNPHDPGDNVRGGALYLRQMLELFGGDVELALAAYNAGPEAVRRHGGVPPYRETRAFVASVMGYMAQSALPEGAVEEIGQ